MRASTMTSRHGGRLPDPVDAWMRALDALEADLEHTNELLDGVFAQERARVALERASKWRVPQGLGPLPPELAQRATEVLTQQKTTATRLARAMAESRQHTKIIEASRPTDRPVYLDTEG